MRREICRQNLECGREICRHERKHHEVLHESMSTQAQTRVVRIILQSAVVVVVYRHDCLAMRVHCLAARGEVQSSSTVDLGQNKTKNFVVFPLMTTNFSAALLAARTTNFFATIVMTDTANLLLQRDNPESPAS